MIDTLARPERQKNEIVAFSIQARCASKRTRRYKPAAQASEPAFPVMSAAQASEPAFPGNVALASTRLRFGLVFVQLQNWRVGLVFAQLQNSRVRLREFWLLGQNVADHLSMNVC